MKVFHLFILFTFCVVTINSFPLSGDVDYDESDEKSILLNNDVEEDFAPPPKQANVPKKPLTISSVKATTNQLNGPEAILTCPSKAPANCKDANFFKLDSSIASKCINAGCTSPQIGTFKVPGLVSEESNDDLLQESDDDLEGDFSDENISEEEDFAPPSRQVGTRSPSTGNSYRTATSQKHSVWRYYCHFISKNAPSYCHGAKRKDIGKEKSALCEKAGCEYIQSTE